MIILKYSKFNSHTQWREKEESNANLEPSSMRAKDCLYKDLNRLLGCCKLEPKVWQQ